MKGDAQFTVEVSLLYQIHVFEWLASVSEYPLSDSILDIFSDFQKIIQITLVQVYALIQVINQEKLRTYAAPCFKYMCSNGWRLIQSTLIDCHATSIRSMFVSFRVRFEGGKNCVVF